jgi:hypothetical protein
MLKIPPMMEIKVALTKVEKRSNLLRIIKVMLPNRKQEVNAHGKWIFVKLKGSKFQRLSSECYISIIYISTYNYPCMLYVRPIKHSKCLTNFLGFVGLVLNVWSGRVGRLAQQSANISAKIRVAIFWTYFNV